MIAQPDKKSLRKTIEVREDTIGAEGRTKAKQTVLSLITVRHCQCAQRMSFMFTVQTQKARDTPKQIIIGQTSPPTTQTRNSLPPSETTFIVAQHNVSNLPLHLLLRPCPVPQRHSRQQEKHPSIPYSMCALRAPHIAWTSANKRNGLFRRYTASHSQWGYCCGRRSGWSGWSFEAGAEAEG